MLTIARIRARLALASLIAVCQRRGVDGPAMAAIFVGAMCGSTAALSSAVVLADAATKLFISTTAAECAARPAAIKEIAE